MLAWVAAHEFMLIGIIWMLVIGPAIGNYACSVVYRLPRGKTPFERHPFCGHCNADLKPIDLFPIVSWCMTRGKCRYCGGPIPGVYTVIEVACAAIFIGYFLHFGMGEPFLLYAAYGVFTLIVASIQWQQGWITATMYSYAFVCVTLVRALSEHTINGVVQSAFVMLVLSLATDRLFSKSKATPFDKPWIWWMVLLGALVPMGPQWLLIVPVVPIALLAPRDSRLIVFAFAALAMPLFLA